MAFISLSRILFIPFEASEFLCFELHKYMATLFWWPDSNWMDGVPLCIEKVFDMSSASLKRKES